MEQETDLSRLIDQNVFESKQHCVISYGAREGKMNCNLCKDVVKKAKAKPEVEFINAYPGGGVNYHRGVVILTDSLLKKDFKTMTPSVGKFYQQMLQEHGINNFYALPNVKCELAPLDLKATGKITSNCLELSRHIIVNRLKPKVVVTDDVATFNYYTGMRFMSAGKVVNHVMWSPDLNCYLLLILNVHKYLAEAAISKERQLEQVKLNCLNRSFTIISKILKGEYEEQIIRCSKVDYRKITKHSPAADQELMFSTLAAQKELAIDIETTGLVPGGGLRPWDSRITSLAITYDIGKSYVYPWQYIVDNRERFQSLFSNPAITKIWANGAFDLSHLNYAGFEFVGPHIDILVWNYLYRNGLDYDLSLMDTYQSTRTKSRDTNTLKFLARIYSDLGFYEKEIKAAGGIVKAQEGLEESADEDSDEDSETSDVGQGLLFENLMIQDVNPESNLRLADAAELKMVDEPKSTEMTAVDRYNAADTDATFRARIALEKRLDKKLMDFYWLLMEPLIFEVIVPIYLSGIRVDLEYLDTLEKRYFGDGTNPGEMQVIEKQWIEAMRKEILESEIMTAEHVLTIYKKDLKNYESTYSKPLPNTKEELIDHIELNINSPTKILKTYQALGYLTSDAKSVDGGVLKHLVSKGIPSAVAKSAYQPVSKLYTTYVKAIKEKQIDGFIHCIFNTFFTTTGRLCVAGDTEVLTDQGPVRIDQLHPALGTVKVLTHKGRWMPVIQKIYKGQETMYEVETECGEKITCTAGHRFLTLSGWRHLSELKVGSKVRISSGTSNESSLSSTLARIAQVGVRDVWDIEVAEDHSYVANGFINHNSSSDPNMQNIPANDTVKNIFVSRPGYSFIDLDYSQAELRVVGEYANEQTFIDAYVNDKDIHWEMVMKMFNVTFPYQPKKPFFEHIRAVAQHLGLEVDPTFTAENWTQYLQQVKDGTFAFEGSMKEIITTIEKWTKYRDRAKTLNFSILYGSSEYGLARNIYKETYDYVTDTKRKEYLDECKGLLESWFKSVPNIKKWLEDNFAFAKKHGYVETIYGRRRYLVFSDSNYWKFQNSARREAGNTPIQSTASDICCLAAVEFQRFIRRPEHIADGCRIVNIVHDNILAEVPDEKTEYYFNALKHIMENVVNPLKIVPLKVDGQIIKRWGK